MPSDIPLPRPEGDELATMRVDYTPDVTGGGPSGASVDDRDVEPADLTGGWDRLLRTWFAAAVAAAVPEPNAMVLATVDEHGHPATRTVLCKKIDADGLAFYTNFESDKGRHLAARPYASATFLWLPIYRQVTVRGPVVRVPDDETLAYWRTRPRGSRLGAWASQQSRPVGDRVELERALVEAAEQYDIDDDIPVPAFWGGFRIVPESVEFWQGRPNRLHNRVRTRSVDGRWIAERLQP